jgi:hypothetical protein
MPTTLEKSVRARQLADIDKAIYKHLKHTAMSPSFYVIYWQVAYDIYDKTDLQVKYAVCVLVGDVTLKQNECFK